MAESGRSLGITVNTQGSIINTKSKIPRISKRNEKDAYDRWKKIKMIPHLLFVLKEAKRISEDAKKLTIIESQTSNSINSPYKLRVIIQPDTLWKLIFDFIASCLILYFCIVIPFRLAFQDRIENSLIIHELVFDMYILLWVSLNFVTAYYEDITLVENFTKIAKSYLKGRFIFDFIACFPFYLIDPQLYWLKCLRFTRAISVYYRFKEIMLYLTGSKEKAAEWLKLNLALEGMKVVTIIGLIVHCIACMWIYITVVQTNPISDSWINKYMESNYVSYVNSLYWTVVTFVTVGYGDITPLTNSEIVFTMFVQLQGIILFALFMGNMTAFVGLYYKNQMTEREEQTNLNRWLMLMDTDNEKGLLSLKLRKEITSCYESMWKNEKFEDIFQSNFYMRMPGNLRKELLKYIFYEDLRKFTSFFDEQLPSLNNELIEMLQSRLISQQGTTIISIDCCPDEIYLINSGEVHINLNGNNTILTLPSNSYFAEDLVIFDECSAFNYISGRQITEVLTLSSTTYKDIISHFPQDLDRIRKRAFLRRKYLKAVEQLFIDNSHLLHTELKTKLKNLIDEFKRYELTLEENEEAVALAEKVQKKLTGELSDIQQITEKFSWLTTKLDTYLLGQSKLK